METEEKGTVYQISEQEHLFGLAKINKKIRIVCGQNVVSQKEFDTFEDAESYIASKPYELILNTAVLLFKFTQEDEKISNVPTSADTKRLRKHKSNG